MLWSTMYIKVIAGCIIIYKDTMQTWEVPYEKEEVTEEQKEKIIQEVTKNMSENTV